MDLRGRVALVTGSNRGIGHGIARELARAGADVVVNYLEHADEAAQVASEIRRLGRRATTVAGDIGTRDDVERIVAQGESELGPIDICVNNAARSIRKPFLELTNADVEAVFGVSLVGTFAVSQVCARRMVQHGKRGVILMIGSVHSFVPFPTSLAYDTAKAGLRQMCHTMAEELLPHRIRVNVIEPGWIDTPGEREFASEEQIKAEGRKLPWGRLGTIEDVGKAAAYLASDDADYVNATTLRVDGGFWLPNVHNDAAD